MIRLTLFLRPATILIPVVVLAGCSRYGEVSGKVTYNGAPLNRPGGHIVFVDTENSQVEGPIGAGGAYRLDRVRTGMNRVAVYYVDPEAKSKRRMPEKGKPPPPPAGSPFFTPLKYASQETSALSIEIESSGTVFNVDMKGPTVPDSREK